MIRAQMQASGKHLSQPPTMHDTGLLNNSLHARDTAAYGNVR
jgi:hypothetical protein